MRKNSIGATSAVGLCTPGIAATLSSPYPIAAGVRPPLTYVSGQLSTIDPPTRADAHSHSAES